MIYGLKVQKQLSEVIKSTKGDTAVKLTELYTRVSKDEIRNQISTQYFKMRELDHKIKCLQMKAEFVSDIIERGKRYEDIRELQMDLI
jgi:hypothetical protein